MDVSTTRKRAENVHVPIVPTLLPKCVTICKACNLFKLIGRRTSRTGKTAWFLGWSVHGRHVLHVYRGFLSDPSGVHPRDLAAANAFASNCWLFRAISPILLNNLSYFRTRVLCNSCCCCLALVFGRVVQVYFRVLESLLAFVTNS